MKSFLTIILIFFFSYFQAQESNNAIGFYTSGLEHYNKQNYTEAIDEYTKAIEINPDFAEAFLQADILIVTAIYQARENPIDGITAQIITDEAKLLGHKQVELIMDQNSIPARLKEIAQADDMIITMGAGNIWRQCEQIYEAIQN